MNRSTLQKSLFACLITLLLIAPTALSAQEVDLSETISVIVGDSTLTANYPDGWFAEINTAVGAIYIATSEEALETTMTGGIDYDQGEVGISIIPPAALETLGVDTSGDPVDVLNSTVAALAQDVDVEVEPFDGLGFPGAITQISDDSLDADVLLVALDLGSGIVVAGIQPSDPDSAGATQETQDIVEAIIKSITLTNEAVSTTVTEGEVFTAEVELPSGMVEFSIAVPDGWVTEYNGDFGAFYMATSDDALEAVTGALDADAEFGDDVAISIAFPTIMDVLGLEINADPEDAVNTFVEFANAELRSDILREETEQGVPVRIAPAAGDGLPGGSAVVAAAAFDAGTILVVISPTSAFDQSIIDILDTIQFGGETGEQSESLSFEVELPTGPVEFSVTVPEGWVTQHNDQPDSFYMASSQDVLDIVSGALDPDAEFAEGDLAISIALPEVLDLIGVDVNAAPEDAINAFLSQTQTELIGEISLTESAGIPIALASAEGQGLPGGTAEIAAAAFDAGTILVIISPGGSIDDTVIAVLDSIRFDGQGAPIEVAEQETTETTTVEPISQWASDVDGTSQYGSSDSADWGFDQATGEPDTKECADRTTAWASSSSTGRDILTVSFDTAVIPTEVNIVQTYNPGAIVQIDVANSDNPDLVLPIENSADPVGNTDCPGVFTLDLSHVDEPIDTIVIYLDQSLTGNWNEIDAVELVGVPAE